MTRSTRSLLLLAALLPLAGCKPSIANRSYVQIEYTGTLRDGTVFDTSVGGEPLAFVVGVGQMLPAFEEGVRGLHVGETKRIQIDAADAFGEYDEEAVQEVDRSEFPEDLELEAGLQFPLDTPDGTIILTIKEIREGTVLLDFNHPLAGQDLIFDVEVLSVRRATDEELSGLTGSSQ